MAYPTTSLLSDFNVADETILSDGGKWLNSTIRTLSSPSRQPCAVETNRVRRVTGGTVSESVFGTSYGADQEAFITVPVTSTTSGQEFDLYFRITNEGTTSVRAIDLAYEVTAGAPNWNIYWLNNTTYTLYSGGVVSNQVISAGDSFGGQLIGNTLEVWYKAAAGSWTSLGSRTDANVTGAGKIGIAINGATFRGDDFGGGTYVSAAEKQSFYMRRMRSVSR